MKFFRNIDGVSALEFSLIAPVMIIMLLGAFEVGRFIHLNQKAEKLSFTVADVVAQAETIKTADLQNLLSAAEKMMSPYPFATQGKVIISSVVRGASNSTVRWQYCGGGTYNAASGVGVVNGVATLPAVMTLNSGEDIVVAEVIYNFQPIVGKRILPARVIRKIAYFKPRLGALSGYTSTCP
jgi:Flp pilus assembly protein TadG